MQKKRSKIGAGTDLRKTEQGSSKTVNMKAYRLGEKESKKAGA